MRYASFGFLRHLAGHVAEDGLLSEARPGARKVGLTVSRETAYLGKFDALRYFGRRRQNMCAI
jgi:hypothetical protein